VDLYIHSHIRLHGIVFNGQLYLFYLYVIFCMVFILSPNIQVDPRGKVNILRGHKISAILKKKCIGTCVLFRMVSEIELPYFTVQYTVHCTDAISKSLPISRVF
jgi:hypothetical protein